MNYHLQNFQFPKWEFVLGVLWLLIVHTLNTCQSVFESRDDLASILTNFFSHLELTFVTSPSLKLWQPIHKNINVYLYNILGGCPFHPSVMSSVPSSIHPSSSSRKKKMMEEEDNDEWRQQQFIQMFTQLLIG